MKYKAVIFDLFGTLIRNFTVQQHEGVLREMASIVSAPADDFIRLWYETFDMRSTGVLATAEDNIDYVCRELGVDADGRQINKAGKLRRDFTRDTMIPFPDAIETLNELKNRDYKIGLVSDCSSEVPDIWPDTPFAPLFDITILSCSAGIKKPDPRIYRMTSDKLEVKPEDCLYIGDGSSNELTGAAAAGMNPVLIRHPEEDNPGIHRVDFEGSEWKGEVITSLTAVLELVE